MARKVHGRLSALEREAIEKINLLRTQHRITAESGHLLNEAVIVHDLLLGYHGYVKLRLEVISGALGCTMRSLQRTFVAFYGQTMNSFHERVRVEYAEQILSSDPGIKLMSIAADLGYDRESEFNRFFRRKRGISLTEFAQVVRSKRHAGASISGLDLD
jgi:AraC-like DNA-binding protein